MKPFDQDRRTGCRRSQCRRSQCGRSRRRLRVGLLRIALLALALCGAIAPSLAQTPTSENALGSQVQGSFLTNHAVLADGRIHALALQHDGRIVFGGSSQGVAGRIRWGIGRLHPDGSLDEDFDLGFLAGLVNPGQIRALALQHDD